MGLHCTVEIRLTEKRQRGHLMISPKDSKIDLVGDTLMFEDRSDKPYRVYGVKFEKMNDFFRSIPNLGVDLTFHGWYHDGKGYQPCYAIIKWSCAT